MVSLFERSTNKLKTECTDCIHDSFTVFVCTRELSELGLR